MSRFQDNEERERLSGIEAERLRRMERFVDEEQWTQGQLDALSDCLKRVGEDNEN